MKRGVDLKKIVVLYISMMFLFFTIPALISSCQRPKIQEPVIDDEIVVNVYDCNINEIVKLGLEEYIIGVVSAEMPDSFHIEALKAQALAARTYTLIRMRQFGGKGCTNHEGADICTDYAHCQAYKDPKKSGKGYKKVYEAVMATKGEIIVYEEHLIDAVFHSTSGGKTENSEDVWSDKVPYLRSVVSEFEESSPKLVSVQNILIDDFISGLKEMDSGVAVTKKSLINEMKVLNRSEGGRILEIQIGNKIFSGREIRERFELNSSNFSFDIKKNEIIFYVIGYGHGIGMSQYGANGMAENGYDYRSIVRHYYQGVEIANIESLM